MLINALEPEESRIAIVENGLLEELYLERASSKSHVGDIFKARVLNMQHSIQAAFVDIGHKKNGFLHCSEVMIGKSKRGGRIPQSPKIQALLKPKEELMVQITKEGIGTKGPAVTNFISLPGRYLVLMPGVNKLGVSRKIDDETERTRLKRILSELKVPKDMGLIIRTAGVGQTKREVQRDLGYLLRLWKVILKRMKKSTAPSAIYQENDLVIRTIRDIYSPDIEEILIDSEPVYKKVRDFLNVVMPKHKGRVKLYEDREPLFHRFKLEEEIEKIHLRKVPLKRGGSIVIEQTEALVAVDVNSGSFRGTANSEDMAYQINIEAAVEIARQLRLRDLGGVIINDFIDMRLEKNRRAVEKAMTDAVKRDRARTRILRISQFGIIQMTRQRVKPSLKRTLFQDCPQCNGTGFIKSPESMSLGVMRQIKAAMNNPEVEHVRVIVNPEAADYLYNKKRRDIVNVEEQFGKDISIESSSTLAAEEAEFVYLDKNGEKV